MARPVINNTQSVLGYLQGETFSFQPAATNTPTGWSASTLPAGLAIDGTTGLITGAATLPGVYIVNVYATNADGTSDPEPFTFGIEASSIDPSVNAIELQCDLGSRIVSAPDAVDRAVLFSAKRGDDLIVRVRFTKGGAPTAVTMTALKLALKELDEDPVEVTSSAMSDLTGGVYLVYMALASASLDDSLSSHEQDDKTAFVGSWELEWTATNTLGIGPNPARGSSRTFTAEVVRDLIP